MSPEADEKLPEPENHGPLPPFHTLITGLLRPLSDNEQLRMLTIATRKGPSEVRDDIIRQFIKNWRKKVGNDIYPAFRLVLPQLDKERAMYGLKESALGKVLVKVLNINPTSPDAEALSKWKSGSAASAGNFSQRAYEILAKRDTRTTFGDLSIGDVNDLLEKLSTEKEQHLPVIRQLIHDTNAEEMGWIVRIILRSVRIGSSEKRFFNMWHPDAESLYSVTSDLKRVCWQLWDPMYRLPSKENQIHLMNCFQPQLASFRRHGYDKLDDILQASMPSGEFYIEEKMDGERIQIHYAEYGKKVKFWSRRIKDYSYLYGNSVNDENGSMTKHLPGVINPRVVSCIIDGEMVAWDSREGGIAPFGTLKTAAAGDIQHMYPMFLAFDLVYLNGKSLVNYPLRERKAALKKIVTPKQQHFEILSSTLSNSAQEVYRTFQRVVEQASEGLVIKDPGSAYRVNERNSSWLKIKPEYSEDFGEQLDVVIIGGYHGSGSRGNSMGSFLCGVRGDDGRFISFCRVGGGFSATDFGEIRNLTEGKWHKFDRKNLPKQYMEVELEAKVIPDEWIKPQDSVVIEVKAAQIVPSKSFKTQMTLRFPRFRSIRRDRTYENALSLRELVSLDAQVKRQDETVQRAKNEKKKRNVGNSRTKRTLVGQDGAADLDAVSRESSIFKNLTFFVPSDVVEPIKMNKGALEERIKKHGGSITQNGRQDGVITIADRRLVKVAGVINAGKNDVLRPTWVYDSISTGHAMALEPHYIYHGRPSTVQAAKRNVDTYGDSMSRLISPTELAAITKNMTLTTGGEQLKYDILDVEPTIPLGMLYPHEVFYFDYPSQAKANCLETKVGEVDAQCVERQLKRAQYYAEFCGATTTTDLDDTNLTVIIVHEKSKSRLAELRAKSILRPKAVKVTSHKWILECWKEGTRLSSIPI